MTYRVRPFVAIFIAIIAFWAVKTAISYTASSSFRVIAISGV